MVRFQALCSILWAAYLPLAAATHPPGSSWTESRSAGTAEAAKGDPDLGDVPGTFLSSGDAVTFSLPAVNQPTLFLEGYRIEVPQGGHDRLEIDVEMLTPGVDLALFVRFGQDVEVINGEVVIDQVVDTPGVGSELLVITPGVTEESPFSLQPGVYYVGLGLLTTGTPIKARITATVSGGPLVDPVGVRLTNGVPANITLPAVQTPTIVAGGLGFRIDVPDGTSRLHIDAELDDPDADFQLLVRYGFDVQLLPDGFPLADQSSPGLGPSQTVSVTLNSEQPITGGTYWIGLGLQSIATPFEGTIVASFDVGGQVPATIELSTASLSFNGEIGTNPPSQQFTVRNAGDGSLNYLISVDQDWVKLSVTAGSSSGEVDPIGVSVDTTGLGGGVHLATISVTGDGGEPVLIQVQLVLSAEGVPAIGLAVTELIFNLVEGSDAGVQTFTLTNAGLGVLNYELSANVPWLEVSPEEGASSGESDAIAVTADPTGLGLGTFIGAIEIRDDSAGLIATLPVTLNVVENPPRPSATVDQLTFEAAAGGPLPAPQVFSVSNAGEGTLSYEITTSQPWVTVEPSTGMVVSLSNAAEFDTITVTVNPVGLPQGTHEAEITVSQTAKGVVPEPTVIDVTLTVVGDLTPLIRDDGVVNGATFAGPELEAHASTPGSIVSIFGDDMVLFTEAAASIPLPSELGGVRVEFDDGVNEPMEAALFVAIRGGDSDPPLDFDQINAQMPWGLDTSSGFVSATVFTGEKAVSPPRMVPVAEASPGIFTFEFGGGLAAIQNFKLSEEDDVIHLSIAQPEGSVCPVLGISPESCTIVDQPARVGGVIVIFANGLGLLDGPVDTGDIQQSGELLSTVKDVRVFFGAPENQVQGTTLFSGLQQFLVGLNQINVIVPDVEPGDAVPIQIEVECEDGATIRSRPDVTIAVRSAP